MRVSSSSRRSCPALVPRRGVTALTTYSTRYSGFDFLLGEIGATLYAWITQMAIAEKAPLIAGALLVAASLAGLLTLLRRPAAQQ